MKKSLLLLAVMASIPLAVNASDGAMAELLQRSGTDSPPEMAAPKGAAARAKPKSDLQRFARCTGSIDETPIVLDFLKAAAPGKDGEMRMILPGGFAVEHRLVIGADDEKGTRVELFAALDPAVRFAEFSIPRASESRVTIHAIHFRADWVTVDCKREPGR